MDPVVKRKIMIGIIAGCFCLALVITLFSRSGGERTMGPVQMLCTNPDCGKAFEMSRSDYNKKMEEMAGRGRIGLMGPAPTFACPYCGEESAYIAIECEECGEVFVMNYVDRNDYSDRCPECGYSKAEGKRRHRK